MWPSPQWRTVTYWALDLETGGLDTRHDPIIAVGMLPVRDGIIRVGEAYETLVRLDFPHEITPESMRAHHLVPSEVAGAPPLPEVLAEVDRRLREGALLVHNAGVDVAFLKRGYRASGMRWPSPRVVDTVHLLLKLAKRERFIDPDAITDPQFNLAKARRELGLPDYEAHRALVDAVAAAELFLLLRQRLGARRLRDLR